MKKKRKTKSPFTRNTPLFATVCLFTVAMQTWSTCESVAQAPKNIAVYATKRIPIKFEEVKKLASEGTVTLSEGQKNDWQSIEIEWPDVTVKLGRSSITTDGSLIEHLNGFGGYAFQRLAGGKMDAHVFSIIRQIKQTNHLYSFQTDPDITSQHIGDFVKALAKSEKAIIFVNVDIYDADMNTLLGAESSRDEEAQLPVFESSIRRREKSIDILEGRNLKVFPDLPWVVADEQVRMQDAKEVARRAICLCAIAAYSEKNSAEKDSGFNATEFLTKHSLMDSLSPNELAFLNNQELTDADKSTLTWRYEAAWSLLWALGKFDEIGFPDSQSDAKKSLMLVMDDPATLIKEAKLRPTEEILDANDILYRCMWTCRDSRRTNKGADPEGLLASVVYERLYALNWLIRHGNAEWDQVQTDS